MNDTGDGAPDGKDMPFVDETRRETTRHTKRWLRGLLAVALLAVGCSREQAQEAEAAQLPVCEGCNVLLLTIDCLRADRLPCQGYDRPTMPQLCQAAQRGVLFERAMSQSSWTKPSMATLFTSVYPHNHKANDWEASLSPKLVTWAEALRSVGYHTVAYQTNPFVSKGRGFAQGFREYHFRGTGKADELVSSIISKLKALRQGRRVFGYVHFMDAHEPYHVTEAYYKMFDHGYAGRLPPLKFARAPDVRTRRFFPDEADRKHAADLYDASLRLVDDQLGRLFDFLDTSGLGARTIVVVLSDHGEEFWEHGGFEHGHTMYQELLHVPLIVLHPRLSAGPVRVRQLVRLIDVYPTVMGMLGLEAPPTAMGEDLTPQILGGASTPIDRQALAEANIYGPPRLALQTDRYKLIEQADGTKPELYDLSDDPNEQRDLTVSPASTKRLKSMKRALDTIRRTGRVTAGKRKPLPPGIRRQLESLGYIK